MMHAKGEAYEDEVRCLISIVEELRKYDPQMDITQLLMYLTIVAQPGMRVTDLRLVTGLPKSSLSRHILWLSYGEYQADKRAKAKPGHDLITTVSDPFDARAQLAAPTRRGQWLMEKIAGHMRRLCEKRAGTQKAPTEGPSNGA